MFTQHTPDVFLEQHCGAIGKNYSSGNLMLRCYSGIKPTERGKVMNEQMEAVKAGIEVNPSGGMAITGDAIGAYRLMALIQAYALEINTGMKAMRNPLSWVAQGYGVTARSKKKALRELLVVWENTYGEPLEIASVVKALAK